MKQSIKESADSVLNRPTSPLTPRRRKAYAKFQQAKFRADRNSKDASLKTALKSARSLKYVTNEAHIADQCSGFFGNLNSHHPAERVKQTFKFLSKFKKQSSKFTNKTFIPISHWYKDIKMSGADEEVKILPEARNFERAKTPSPEEIFQYLSALKNNTAPGNDRISIEFLKYGPPSLFIELSNLISKAFENNPRMRTI